MLPSFESIQLQLGELDVEIAALHVTPRAAFVEQARQAKRAAERQHARAVFWFGSPSEDSFAVYALHAPSGRVFAREVKLTGNETVQREQLAVVLRAAVPAVLQGAPDVEPLLVVPNDPVGADTPAAVETPGPIETPASPPPRRLRIAAGYFGSRIASSASWQSGVSGELTLDVTEWFRASFGAGYAAPTTLHADGADALVARVPIMARGGVGYSLGQTTLALEAGALTEAWHRRTVLRSDALSPTEPKTSWRFGATLSGRLEIALFGDIGLYVCGEAQWFPADHQLAVRSPETEGLATHALRAQLGLGATWILAWTTSPHDDDGRPAK